MMRERPSPTPSLRIPRLVLSLLLGGLLGWAHSLPAAVPIDIIIAVDTSGDMEAEALDLVAGLNGYAALLASAGGDPHIVVIGSDLNGIDPCVPAPLGSGACPGDELLPGYRHVSIAIASSNALAMILATHAQWAPSLRPGAVRVIIVVSSDESSLTAAAFQLQLLALDPTFQGYQFHAYVAHSFCPLSGGADVGDVYLDLVAATGGVTGDLCSQTITPFLTESAMAAIALASVFRRGDANRDGAFDIADAIATLGHLFSGSALACRVAGDSNDDEALDIGDAIAMLAALFSGGSPLPPPAAGCAADPTPGSLDCLGALPCL
jgi:hypothetical protein